MTIIINFGHSEASFSVNETISLLDESIKLQPDLSKYVKKISLSRLPNDDLYDNPLLDDMIDVFQNDNFLTRVAQLTYKRLWQEDLEL